MSPADPRLAGTVIFDLDTTLVLDMDHARAAFSEAALLGNPEDPEPLAEAAIGAARDLWRASPHLSEGKRLGIASWEVLWADFAGAHECLDAMRKWAPQFRHQVWARAIDQVGLQGNDADSLARAFVEAQRLPHPLVPGGVEALRAVAASGRQVGILTNGPPDIQRYKLAQLEIDALVSAVVVSGEVGIGKPDPDVFAFALDALGAKAEETVMVGDSWNRDVEGARASGLAAVWLSFSRPVPDPTLEGIVVVDDTERLGEALGC